ncbi:Saposin B-type domain-containing protein [Entamoeba marina]
MLIVVLFFIVIVQSTINKTLTKTELNRFKTLVSQRIDKELSRDKLSIIHTHHLKGLYSHYHFLKETLSKVVKMGKSMDRKRVEVLNKKIKNLREKILKEKFRLDKRRNKIAGVVKKGLMKYQQIYVDETLNRLNGVEKALDIRIAKEKFQEELSRIKIEEIKHKTTRHELPNHKEIENDLQQKKLKTKILFQKTIKHLSKNQHLINETEDAQFKENSLRKELFDLQLHKRLKYVRKVISLRKDLLSLHQRINDTKNRLKLIGNTPTETHKAQLELKSLLQSLTDVKNKVSDGEMKIRNDIKKLIRNSFDRISVVGESMIQLNERAAYARNNVMMNYVRMKSKQITGNSSIWDSVNGMKIVGHNKLSIEQESKHEENHFKRVVVEEIKQIQNVLKIHKHRQSVLIKTIGDKYNTTNEWKSVDVDLRLLGLGIDKMRKYIQEALVRSQTTWAVIIGKGMIERKEALVALATHCSKIKGVGKRYEAEFQWEAMNQIQKDLNGIKELNAQLMVFGLKEFEIAERLYENAKQNNDTLVDELYESYSDWKSFIKRSLERLRNVEKVNIQMEKCSDNEVCEKCVKLSGIVRSGILSGLKDDVMFGKLKEMCNTFDRSGLKNCNQIALKLVALYTKNNLQFLMSNSCNMCKAVGVCPYP